MSKQLFEVFGRYIWEWIIFAAVSLVFAALFAYHVFQHHELIMTQERDRLVHLSAVSEAMISRQLEDISTTLDKIRTEFTPGRERNDDTSEALSERLKILAFAMPNVQTVLVLDTQGVVAASSDDQLIGQSFAHRDYFRACASAPSLETLYVSEPFKDMYGDWLIALSKAAFDRDGAFAGIVLASLNAREYTRTLNTLRPTPQAWANLVHGDGILFAWEPDTMAFTGQNLAQPGTLFTRHIQSRKAASFFSDTVAANNERSLIAIQTIDPVNLHMSTPLVTGIGRNLDALNRELQMEALYLFAIVMLFNAAGGIALYLSQRGRRVAVLNAKKAEAHLRELSQQMTSFFGLTPSLMVITDKEGHNRRLNPACQKELGYTAEDIRQTSLFEYVHPDDLGRTRLAFDDLLVGRPTKNLVIRFRRKDGVYRYLEVSMAAQNEMLFLAALDVTDRETEKEQLNTLAYHDRLTGLPNRALLFDRLHQVIATASRGKKKAAIMFIDLDGFKTINDNHGHDAGDKVLMAVAQRLADLVRKADTVSRLGGDEFVIILHEVGSENDAVMVAQKVMDAAGKNIPLDSGETARVGTSIGISIWPDHGVGMDDLLVAADRAMYQSKKTGKNTFTIAFEDTSDHNGICFGDKYGVGISLIDAQHLELAGLVDTISTALRKGYKPSAITELVNKLQASTKHHFDTEHDFMERYAYPHREHHDEKHRILLEELQEISPALSMEGEIFLVQRLHDWLLTHILEEDKPLGNFLMQFEANCADI